MFLKVELPEGYILSKGIFDYILDDAEAMKVEDSGTFAALQLKTVQSLQKPKVPRIFLNIKYYYFINL